MPALGERGGMVGSSPLHLEVFQDLCGRWGIQDVDLLTSSFNNKLKRFVFRYRDPLAGLESDKNVAEYGFPCLEIEGIPVIFIALH